MDVIATLLSPPPAPLPDLAAHRARWRTDRAAGLGALDRALLGGWRADRLGYAFAAGYSAAADRLAPGADGLAVTEDGGAHPRAVATRLAPAPGGWSLTGDKRWATLADAADTLLVAASEGWEGDRNRLRVVRVRADAAGVVRTPMPAPPFCPEIGHFALRLEDVRVTDADVLPGDGWTRWIKPFRTLEDLHVSAAAAAHLLRVARANRWPPTVPSRLTALILSFRGLADADPDAPGTHVALGGCLAALDAIGAAAAPHWAATDAETAARWRRDVPLLGLAGKARAARFELAWKAIAGA